VDTIKGEIEAPSLRDLIRLHSSHATAIKPHKQPFPWKIARSTGQRCQWLNKRLPDVSHRNFAVRGDMLDNTVDSRHPPVDRGGKSLTKGSDRACHHPRSHLARFVN
jgi:hypothetical protein